MAQPSASVSQLAIVKALLHAHKHPYATVNGALLGRVDVASGAVRITDAVPLFHTTVTLAPPIEIALSQLEAHVNAPSSSMQLVGYYHAEARSPAGGSSSDPPAAARRIAERIADHTPGAVMLVLDGKRLGSFVKAAGEGDGPLDLYSKAEGSRLWKREAGGQLTVEQGWSKLREALLAAIQNSQHRDIHDFDEHLDDVSVDYLNAKFVWPPAKFALPGQLA